MGDAERNANRMGMLELVRPGGLGDFRVLLQRRGETTGHREEQAYSPPQPLEPPLLSTGHARLISGRYPHAAEGVPPDLERLWPFGHNPGEDSRSPTR